VAGNELQGERGLTSCFYALQRRWVFFIISLVSYLAGAEKTPVAVYDLPHDMAARVDSIIIQIHNAFDGSRVNWDFEESLFKLGNRLHINTRDKTIKKHLLFAEGDQVTREILIESEMNLRRKNFLADAIIEVEEKSGQDIVIHVTVFDQWSTTPGTGLKRVGNQLTYWAGLSEKNLLGTGQSISISFHKKLRTKGATFYYLNPGTRTGDLYFSTYYSKNDDGFSFGSSLSKPILSKTQKHSFFATYRASSSSMWHYYDGNSIDGKNSTAFVSGETNLLAKFEDVSKRTTTLGLTQSHGHHTKLNVSLFTRLHEQSHQGNTVSNDTALMDELTIRERDDILAGISVSLNQKTYTRTQNLNKLKWTEDFDKIKNISFTLGRNFQGLGANNNDYMVGFQANYTDVFRTRHFLSAHTSLNYFLSPEGEKHDGQFEVNMRYRTKLRSNVNGSVSTYWKNNIGRLPTDQLLLGESNGLNGYPNFYFANQNLILLNTELILIPDLEILTVIPAMAVFASTGNTFPDPEKFELNNLHSAVGIGLRLGLSRSAEKSVSHVNLAWPLDPLMKGPIFSIQSRKNI
jgi:hypothetical protein